MLQAAAVNTLQGLGTQQIKLIADSLDSEAARAALQGLLAGAGATAQGQHVTPAAFWPEEFYQDFFQDDLTDGAPEVVAISQKVVERLEKEFD